MNVININEKQNKYEISDVGKMEDLFKELEKINIVNKDKNGNYIFNTSSNSKGLSNSSSSTNENKFTALIQTEDFIAKSLNINEIYKNIVTLFSKCVTLDEENLNNIDISLINKSIINVLKAMNLIINEEGKNYLNIGNKKGCLIDETKIKEGIIDIIKTCDVLGNPDTNKKYNVKITNDMLVIKDHLMNIISSYILPMKYYDFIQFDLNEIHESVLDLLVKKKVICMKDNIYKINTKSNFISKKELIDKIFENFTNKKIITKNNGYYSTNEKIIKSHPINIENICDDIINVLINFNYLVEIDEELYNANIENNSFYLLNKNVVFEAIVDLLTSNNIVQIEDNKYMISNEDNISEEFPLKSIFNNILNSLNIKNVILTNNDEKIYMTLNLSYNKFEEMPKNFICNKLKHILITNNVLMKNNNQLLTPNYIIGSKQISNNEFDSVFRVLDKYKIINIDKEDPNYIKIMKVFNNKNEISDIIQIILNTLIKNDYIDNYKILYDNEAVIMNKEKLMTNNIVNKLLSMGFIDIDTNKNYNININQKQNSNDYENALSNKAMSLSSESLFSAESDWNDNNSETDEIDEETIKTLMNDGIVNFDDITNKVVSVLKDNYVINTTNNKDNYVKMMKGIVLNKKDTLDTLIEFLSDLNMLSYDYKKKYYVSGKTHNSKSFNKAIFNEKFVEILKHSGITTESGQDTILNINSADSSIEIDVYTFVVELLNLFKELDIITMDDKNNTFILDKTANVEQSIIYSIAKQFISESNHLENSDVYALTDAVIKTLEKINYISSMDSNNITLNMTSIYNYNFNPMIMLKEFCGFIEELLGIPENDNNTNLSIFEQDVQNNNLESLKNKKYKIQCPKSNKVYSINDVYIRFINYLDENNIIEREDTKNYTLILENKLIDINQTFDILLNELVNGEVLGLNKNVYYIKMEDNYIINVNTLKKNIFNLLSKKIMKTYSTLSTRFKSDNSFANNVDQSNILFDDNTIMDVLIKNKFVNINDTGKYSISNLMKLFTNNNISNSSKENLLTSGN